MHSPVKKQETELRHARKREAKSLTDKEKQVLSLKKRMPRSIPPLPKSPPFSPIQETPKRGSNQGIPIPSISINDLIDMDALNQMIEEDNAQAAR